MAVRGVAAFIETLASGSPQAMEAYLAEVSLTRSEMGLDVSEVVEALLLFGRAALPVVRRACPVGSTELDGADDSL